MLYSVAAPPTQISPCENEIFLINKEIQSGSVSKSYMRKGFLIYEEMRKYLTIPVYEEVVIVIYDFATDPI
jgi:hypothetical protein